MLLDDMLAILRKILEQTDIRHIEITDSLNPIHVEYDEESLEPKEDQEFPDEYDLVLKGDLCHAEIQSLDSLLADYDNVEMRLRGDNMEVFETFAKEESS